MKKQIFIVIGFVAFLALIMLYINEREDRIAFESEATKWKEVAQLEQVVPSIDKKAQVFVDVLNDGKHEKMLTGAALEEYKTYTEDEDEHEHEEGEHEADDDYLVDKSMQNVNILMSSTKTNEENQVSSEILYQIVYEGVFDNPDTGIVDQRILTMVMNIDWKKSGKEYLVEQYEVNLVEDNMMELLSAETKGSEPNEETNS